MLSGCESTCESRIDIFLAAFLLLTTIKHHNATSPGHDLTPTRWRRPMHPARIATRHHSLLQPSAHPLDFSLPLPLRVPLLPQQCKLGFGLRLRPINQSLAPRRGLSLCAPPGAMSSPSHTQGDHSPAEARRPSLHSSHSSESARFGAFPRWFRGHEHECLSHRLAHAHHPPDAPDIA
jgi:hypothetical protein